MRPELRQSFDQMWADLESIGRASSGGYRRFAWTREDHTLREWFAGQAAARGLDLTQDRVGNQWAWWGDPDEALASGRPGVATGSHLDSVPDGGAYDGPLGVISAFAALDALRAEGITPQRPIAVVNFVEEEGARFGVACGGSRVLTGAMTAERALALTDDDGLTMARALSVAGQDTRHFGADPEALARVGVFIELHVEQGRGLVDLDVPVGVVRDIWPHGRWRIDLPGEANHAGSTRMQDRRDAMIALARVILAAQEQAVERGCVATIGKVAIEPSGVNAIASHATAWLDSRGSGEQPVRALVAALEALIEGLGGRLAQESWTPPTVFDEALSNRVRRVIGRPDAISVPVLGSGAGHDAGILASAGIPAAMVFVRNPTGISHSPAEFAERDDCYAGVDALAACLTDLVRAEAGGPG
ncbi:MAG: allantoate amidohydrolase [Ornithinimicrobium sp.]